MTSVVIVGAGFGGMSAALALAKVPVEITIVDRNNHHCFQPLLYQVATAALSPGDVAWPIREILRHQANARVLMDTVTGIDMASRRVLTKDLSFAYDTLVLATGATHSYFGHDDWQAVAPGLKRIEDATDIRRRLLVAFEAAEKAADAAERARLLTFVIIGGGPTGVEMAGALADLARNTLARDFRVIHPREDARIILVEGGPRLLPAFPERLSAYTATALRRMGVEVLTGTMVTGCDRNGVDHAGGRIEAGSVIWAAGVMASPAAAWLGVAHDRAGRVQVEADLTLPGHPEVFVIGDTATVPIPAGAASVPGTAPAAKQMGIHVARTVAARLAGKPVPGPFRYRNYGDLATIGRKAAVVKLGRVEMTGFIAWVFWSVAHVYFLINARSRIAVAFKWAWDYVTFQRGVRLITGQRSE